MGIPHRCPVCEGRGEVGKRLAQVGSVVVSQKPLRYRCHSCHGTGVIWDNTFTLQTPNLPFIQTWNNPKIGPDGSPVVPLTLGDGVSPLTFSASTNLGWNFTSDHICPSHEVPRRLCDFCVQNKRYDGASCACSPEGMPHSVECKGWHLGNPSWEDFKE